MATKKSFAESGDERIEGIVTKPGAYVNKFAKSKSGKNIGSWAFIIGFVIALIAGIIAGLNATGAVNIGFGMNAMLIGLLVLIGVVVGLVNISSGESMTFLVAAVAIMVSPAGFSAMASAAGGVMGLTNILGAVAGFLSALTSTIAIFVAPAAIIVALKAIYKTAREA